MFEIRINGESWIKVDSIVPATQDFPYWKITLEEPAEYPDREEQFDYAYFLAERKVYKLEMRSVKEPEAPELSVVEGGEEDGTVSQTEVPILLSEYRDRDNT